MSGSAQDVRGLLARDHSTITVVYDRNVNISEGEGESILAGKSFSIVPFAPDPDFVDRFEISAWIRDKCALPGARAALVGLGGVGYVNVRFSGGYSSKVTKQVAASYPIRLHCL
jgi:hypothetical protein